MIALRTLGVVEVRRGEGQPVLVAPKPLALLVYLALARPAGLQRRDRLLALFYPESDESRARHALRQLLADLRNALGPKLLGNGDRQTAGLDRTALTCDVWTFEQALAHGSFEEAVATYGGSFCAGFHLPGCPDFEEWVAAERMRLRRAFTATLEQLALRASAEGRAQAAADWWRQLLAHEPYASSVTLGLMEALARAGDRAGALNAARAHAERLREELGATPSSEVEALAERLQREPVVHTGTTPTVEEQLAAALAGRYQLEGLVAGGCMSLVYKAKDLQRQRSVAIKVLCPELAAAIGPERFLQEIAVATELHHPGIVPLWDTGRADRRAEFAGDRERWAATLLYYVMPYLEGESLRARLEREGPFPLDDALRITRDVAEALAHAHGKGIIHRDIKPENILLTDERAVVTDFGIARALEQAGGRTITEPGVALGTPAYMSPEQAGGGGMVDVRSDLYSLGCVLYELLAGHPPFHGTTAQELLARHATDSVPSLKAARPSLPEPVEAVVHRALAKSPADRFASAQQFADALEGGAAALPRSRRRTRAVIVSLVAVAVAIAITVALRVSSSSGIPFGERDWVVVAAFQNETGDSIFDGSLGPALRVGLQQSRYVNVVPRARIAETLTQMKRALTARLDEAVGREVALRAHARLLVVPAISQVESTYLLTTRIVDPRTGNELRSRSARARGKDAVLAALDNLVRRLRSDLGESARAVAQNDVRLSMATTASLAALRAYTEGSGYWNAARWDDAAERYRYALSLDSNFAEAHAGLGGYFAWAGQQDSAEYHFAKALSQLDRVTERERFTIQGGLYFARQNWDAAIRTQEVYLQRYPDDVTQRFNLGTAYMRADRLEDALRTFEQVLAIDSAKASAYLNLATSYVRMDSFAAAMPHYRHVFALEPARRLTDITNHEFGTNFVRLGQLDSAEATFNEMLRESPRQRASGHRSLALLRMYRGHYADARPHLERAIGLNRSLHSPVSEFRNRLYLATTYASTGETQAFRESLRAAATIGDTVALGSWWLSLLASGYALVGDTVALSQLVPLIKERVAEGSMGDQAAAAGAEAHLALARGDYLQAIELLHQAVSGADRLYLPLLAEAYQASGDPERATATYLEEIRQAHHRFGGEWQEPWILAHYQLGKLYQEQGDTAKAMDFYRRFLAIWEDGDPELIALADAKRRLRALSPEHR